MISRSCLVVTLTALSLFGCAAGPANRSAADLTVTRKHNYEVSVYSGGERVKNFSEELVHRVELGQGTVKQVLEPWPRRLNLPFNSTSEIDARGKVRGLRVVAKKGNGARAFGIENGDLLTAVNTKHMATERDFYLLFQALDRSESASVTLERKGKAHKILYYLAGTRHS